MTEVKFDNGTCSILNQELCRACSISNRKSTFSSYSTFIYVTMIIGGNVKDIVLKDMVRDWIQEYTVKDDL